MQRKDELQLISLFKKRIRLSSEHEKGMIDDSTYKQKTKEIEKEIQALFNKNNKADAK